MDRIVEDRRDTPMIVVSMPGLAVTRPAGRAHQGRQEMEMQQRVGMRVSD
jgi:hypothetical protein